MTINTLEQNLIEKIHLYEDALYILVCGPEETLHLPRQQHQSKANSNHDNSSVKQALEIAIRFCNSHNASL